jgi:hypothetical protein
LQIRGPEGKVVAEQLHDQRGILVGVLVDVIEFSDGIIEGLLGELARALRGIQDLVVEDREVEGKAEADGVCGRKVNDSDVGGLLVGIEGVLGGVLAVLTSGKLSQVAVVVTLPAGSTGE